MRRLKSAIAVLVALGLLTGLAWFGDRWVRSEIEARIEAGVAEQLPGLDGTLEAELSGRFAIPQLVVGALEEVTLTSPEVVVDGVALTDVVVVATDVPIRGHDPVASIHATGTVPTATVVAAIERRVELPDGITLELRDGEIAAVASVLGVPLEAYVTLVAEPRAVTLAIDRVVLGGATISVDDLPLDLGGLLGGTVVDLEMLPEGVELTSLTVTPDGIDLVLDGTDVATS